MRPTTPPHSLPLRASQVVGGPAWIDSPGYDIEAKPESNTDRKHTWLMLQTLLADRFRLTLHRETRELPVYDLTAGKERLQTAGAQGRQVRFLSARHDAAEHPRGRSTAAMCAVPVASVHRAADEGRKVHMADLIRELAMVLGRPVMDKTGFTGEFDLNLNSPRTRLLTKSPVSAAPDDPGGNRLPTDPNLPIFSPRYRNNSG